jgi:hypothetical protein
MQGCVGLPSSDDLAAVMQTAIMVDGRNYLDPKELAEAEFYYIGIGRPYASQGVPTELLQAMLAQSTVNNQSVTNNQSTVTSQRSLLKA